MDPYIRGEQKKRERNKENTGPDMNDIAANTPDVKKEEISKFRRDLKKLDGQTQNKEGKWEGGGNLKKGQGILDQVQGYREKAKWKGDDNPDPVRGGLSKNPYTVTDEGYSGGIQSSEGPQTTLLRGIETEPNIDPKTGKPRRQKNKNYDY